MRLSSAFLVATCLFAGCSSDDDDGAKITSEDVGMSPAGDASMLAEDAGMPVEDAGMSAEDAGVSAEDAGLPIEDAGLPTEDAGILVEDAGMPVEDAGVSAEDAGAGSVDAGDGVPDAGQPPVLECASFVGAGRACGGDPVGTWEYASACVQESSALNLLSGLAQACPGDLMPHVTSAESDGFLIINSDQTYVRDVVTDIEIEVTVPAFCVVEDCDEMALVIEEADGIDFAECFDVPAGACECTVAIEVVQEDDGAWMEAAPGVLRMNNAYNVYYCVSADSLVYTWTPSSEPQEPVTQVLSRQ